MLLVGFKSIRKGLIKKYIQGNNVTVTFNECFVLLWACLFKKANHLSLNNHFVPLLKLLISTESKLKRKHGLREKVGSLSKVQKKMDNFFSKNFK